MLDLSFSAGPCRNNCQKKFECIFSARPARMLSSVVMPLNSATFWKVRAMPWLAASWGLHARARLTVEGDAPLLRMIEPLMTFSIDVLPAPFGPMIARISPLRC